LGRPVEMDPLGLEPDNNWYRFVGNNPIAATDPGGLQGEAGAMSPASQKSLAEMFAALRPPPLPPIKKGQFDATIIFSWWGDQDESKRKIVRARVLEAAKRIEKAYLALESFPDAVCDRYEHTANLQKLRKKEYREYILAALKKAYDYLVDGNESITIQLDWKNKAKGNPGYVWRFGDTIHFTPFFFTMDDGSPQTEEEQIDTAVHELGRLIPRIVGEKGDSPDDILLFTAVVRNLAKDFSKLREKHRQFLKEGRKDVCPE
jgi:hypothetical protein